MARKQRFSAEQARQIADLQQAIEDENMYIARYERREADARNKIEEHQERRRRAQHDLNELLEAATETE